MYIKKKRPPGVGSLALNSGGVLQNNRAYSGGAVRVTDGTFTMNAGQIINNEASNYGGAVQLADSGADFVLKGGTISGNTAAYGNSISYFDGSFTIDAESLSLSGDVFIKDGSRISLTAVPSDLEITVLCDNFTSGSRAVATSTTDRSGMFSYSGGGHTFNWAPTFRLIYAVY